MTDIHFPPGFLFGAATSAYQIEGGWDADGKGPSIWDHFARRPGRIHRDHTGDVACNTYFDFQTDVEIMRQLGLDAYRFSVAWPRVLPEGRGRVNQAGLDFYSRLVDELLANDIQPFVTLYHWDLPQVLQDAGGWAARSTAEAFVEYAGAVSAALGDRVHNWITHNEPWCISFLSHMLGIHAPGLRDPYTALRAAHHVLLSHGWAVPVIRANSSGAEVGITLNLEWKDPASRSAADLDATRAADSLANRWFLDPLYGRQYPADGVADFAGALPNGLDFVEPGDMAAIAVPTDFLGLNYYTRAVNRAEAEDNLPQLIFPDRPRTDIGWEVYPEGFYNLLNRLHFDYSVPKLYITENGASYNIGPDAGGRVPDAPRLDYLRRHMAAAHHAIANGVPLAGYFVWSLMDNFEWAEGYTQRFGIVWVDYDTQARLPKDSALWYRQVIADNGYEYGG